jgi:hypothetical protein
VVAYLGVEASGTIAYPLVIWSKSQHNNDIFIISLDTFIAGPPLIYVTLNSLL